MLGDRARIALVGAGSIALGVAIAVIAYVLHTSAVDFVCLVGDIAVVCVIFGIAVIVVASWKTDEKTG